MSAPRTRIFTSLARTQFRKQTPHIQTFGRRAYSMSEFQALPSKIIEGAKGDWSIQGRRIVNGLQFGADYAEGYDEFVIVKGEVEEE
ncbi:hypothetical protein ACEPPN_000079 [Leptodophora sp. 'Broadleaf-Isolate-01']